MTGRARRQHVTATPASDDPPAPLTSGAPAPVRGSLTRRLSGKPEIPIERCASDPAIDRGMFDPASRVTSDPHSEGPPVAGARPATPSVSPWLPSFLQGMEPPRIPERFRHSPRLGEPAGSRRDGVVERRTRSSGAASDLAGRALPSAAVVPKSGGRTQRSVPPASPHGHWSRCAEYARATTARPGLLARPRGRARECPVAVDSLRTSGSEADL